MAAYITQVKQAVDKLLRNAGQSGVLTAITPGGPMYVNEHVGAALDATNVWATALGGTGAIARFVPTSGNQSPVIRLNLPAGADTARLTSRVQVRNPTSITLANEIYTRLVLEWVMQFNTLTSFNNATCLFGAIADNSSAVTRAGTNIAGFILTSDAINTLTDDSGTETVNTIAASPTLTNPNKFKMVFRNGAIDFYVNGVLEQTHTANLFASAVQMAFFAEAEAAVTGSLYVRDMRMYAEE